jgi:hypothetical protein
MAEGDCIVMNNFKEQLFLGTVDLVNDDLYIALYEVALNSPDGAAIAYSVTNEIDAANYDAGGKLVDTGKAVTQDDTNNRAAFDADDLVWAALGTHTIAEARLYDNDVTPKLVIALWAIATNSNGGNYTLAFHEDGVLLLS